MSSEFLMTLSESVLLGDGAMGTELQRAGLEPGGCGEAWNLDRPERIAAIQRAYVEAGADCLLTNTFGASRIMLERRGEQRRTVAINRAGVELARAAFGGARGFVLGDIGPFGGLMEPSGAVSRERVAEAFCEQAEALVGAGVDAIVIETQTGLEELEIALAAARAAGAPAVIGSLAFEALADGGQVRTMTAASPEQAAAFLVEHGADVLGLNCGARIDMARAAEVARRYRTVAPLPVMAQLNAGQPVLEGRELVYPESPATMAAGVPALVAAGVRVVGGCCGTRPAHIAAMRAVLDAPTRDAR